MFKHIILANYALLLSDTFAVGYDLLFILCVNNIARNRKKLGNTRVFEKFL